MDAREMVIASLKQSRGYLNRALEGLTQEDVTWKPGEHCNSIAFILWHVARVEDYFFTRVLQRKTALYEADGWMEKLGTPPDSGYGYTVEQLNSWPVPKLEDLRGYADAVRQSTLAYLEQLTPEKMLELVRPDRPPDTIGQVLIRISTEIALHMGQIDYLRGLRSGSVTTEAPQY
ncbi:MAG TPA: DinB family protein [Dehalococcoidia bacterium]|nr:DinB family protein [Dehalococcoidia bacterium]